MLFGGKPQKPRSVLLGFSIVSSHIFILGFMTEAMSTLVFRTKMNLGSVVVDEGREGKT